MKIRLFSYIVLFALLPATSQISQAQQWSDEEQEIIDLNQSCWDAWASEKMSNVEKTCNEHLNAVGWWTAFSAPSPGWYEKNAARWGEAMHPRSKWIYWEVRPLSVEIFKDTALIHFWAMRIIEDAQGNEKTITQKHLNIWQKDGRSWTWIGGMATPEGDQGWQ